MNERPSTSFDVGLQHERTALAWERTAIAMMIAGLVLSRFAAIHEFWLFAAVGLLQTAFGAGLLVWAGSHYEDLHGPLRDGADVVHPLAARVVGVVTVITVGLGLAMAVAIAVLR
ncbi:MAG TPA: DUF202 domain-containing protein [Ilumatobacteraceae bacterium]|nr:DUF202 domain-containing protein [Ilumatobacteraceae bacterium]